MGTLFENRILHEPVDFLGDLGRTGTLDVSAKPGAQIDDSARIITLLVGILIFSRQWSYCWRR